MRSAWVRVSPGAWEAPNGSPAFRQPFASLRQPFRHVLPLLLLDVRPGLAGPPADAARDDGATPLYKACQDGGRTDIVLMLLSAGAQVDQMDNAGMTPLWVACHQGKPVLVRALLDAKADPMRKVQGWGPLDLAKSEGREEIVQLLIEYLPPEAAAAVAAAAVERRAPTQTEELYVACFHGQEATVRQVGHPLPPPSSPAPFL